MVHCYRSRYGLLCAVRALSPRASIAVRACTAGLGLAAFGLMAAGPAAAATTTGSLLAGTVQANVVRSTLGAGYQASHNTFGYVAARLTVPAINCSKWKPGEVVNFWVGLGPSASKSERINIFGQCAGGAPAYQAVYWINNGPNLISYPKVGDKISAAVRYDSTTGKVRFTMYDTTQNQSYNQEHACAVSCARSAAQVVAGPNGEGQLAPYGSITFHRIAITSASGQRGNFTSTYWKNAKIYEYDIHNRTLLAASPSALSNGGTQFTDTWKNP